MQHTYFRIDKASSRLSVADENFAFEYSAKRCVVRREDCDLSILRELDQVLDMHVSSEVRVADGRGRVQRGSSASGQNYILRRYLRGGLVAKFNAALHFSALNRQTSRPIREFAMLAFLRQHGLPVPLPLAASVHFVHSAWYVGAIATEEIPGVEPLTQYAARCNEASFSTDEFSAACRKAGSLAARCLQLGVVQADLHLGNVLYDGAGAVYLIDFDKSRYCTPPRTSHRERVLRRWERSARKHKVFEAAALPFKEGLIQAVNKADSDVM